MSFDIYGNSLRRGHCEVHPHVHEEYPCSVCVEESNARKHTEDKLQREHDEALERQYEIDQLRAELDKERGRVRAAEFLCYCLAHDDVNLPEPSEKAFCDFMNTALTDQGEGANQ